MCKKRKKQWRHGNYPTRLSPELYKSLNLQTQSNLLCAAAQNVTPNHTLLRSYHLRHEKIHVSLSLEMSQRFGYPRVLIIPVPKMLAFPVSFLEILRTLIKRLAEVHLLLKIRINLREKANNCVKLHSLARKKTITCAIAIFAI